MPTSRQHLKQANRNVLVADHVHAQGDHLEWVAVALFYSALHYVDAFFALLNVHPNDHRARQQAVRRWLPRAADDYRDLQDNSVAARYKCYRFQDAEIGDLRTALEQVNREVKDKGGKKLRDSP